MPREPLDTSPSVGGGHLKSIQQLRSRLAAVEVDYRPILGVVNVYSRDDLPDPVAGVITLQSNFVYNFLGAVDLGTDVLEGIDVVMIANSSPQPALTTNSATALLSSTGDGFFNLRGLFLQNTGGPLFDFDFGNDPFVSGVVMDDVVSAGGPCIGTIAAGDRVILTNTFFIGFTTGLRITGTVGELTILDSSFGSVPSAPNFKGLEVTDSASLDIALVNIMRFTTFNAADICVSLDPSATYAKSFRLQGSTLRGPGSFLDPAGLQKSSPELIVTDNTGLEDSLFTGSAGFTGNVVETVIALVSTPVRIGSGAPTHEQFNGGAFTERFTLNDAQTQLQTFTYDGLLPRTFTVRLDAVVTRSGGGSVLVEMAIQKNGVTVADSIDVFDVANLATSVFTLTTVSLTKNDTLELVIANNTGDANLTVLSAKWTVFRTA